MNIKSLLLAPVCALLAVSAASASDVLFSENWSEYEIGAKPIDGTKWRFYSTSGGAYDPYEIQNQGTGENQRKVLAPKFSSSPNFLGYAIINEQFNLGTGISLDVTFMRPAGDGSYFRIAFAPDGGAISGNNFYLADFANSSFSVARGSDKISPGTSVRYTDVGGAAPVGSYVTINFQMMEIDNKIFLRVIDNGVLLWEGFDPALQSVDFSGGITAMIGARAGVTYISDVQVTALVPEPSHFGIAAGAVVLIAAGLLRRRSRRA